MKTGHLNRPKTDEMIYPIHKKIIAMENSKIAPIYFIFRTFSNLYLTIFICSHSCCLFQNSLQIPHGKYPFPAASFPNCGFFHILYPCITITSANTTIQAMKASETLTGERSPLFQSENRLLSSSSMHFRPFRFQSIKW